MLLGVDGAGQGHGSVGQLVRSHLRLRGDELFMRMLLSTVQRHLAKTFVLGAQVGEQRLLGLRLALHDSSEVSGECLLVPHVSS